MIADSADHSFVMKLVYGVVRNKLALQWVLAQRADKMPKGLALAALMVGIYQLLLMDAVPDYAAISTTVEAAKEASIRSTGFINAVLRNVQREREQLLIALQQTALHIRFSHPENLLKRWRKNFGAVATEELCRWNNLPADVHIALLKSAPSITEFQLQLKDAGIEVGIHPKASDTTLILPHGVKIDKVPGYTEGWFIVQDPAARLAVELMDLQPGLRVLDACASPGGKTLLISAAMNNSGRLVAMDLHDDRLSRLRENLKRAGNDFAELFKGDATEPYDGEGEWLFDRILLDVPCSNTGVIRRKPDVRWRFSKKRLQSLVDMQAKLLQNAIKWLAPGGKLVYSTCSLESEENIQQVETFCAENQQYKIVATGERIPMRDDMDGAFAAAITHT
jgi:16S rRNA (cytosine967-C5)-methyltransferase